MELTDEEADLLRESFYLVAAQGPKAADIFYRRLFALAPQVRPLFIGDLRRQGIMLTSTLGVVVAQIQSWQNLTPIVTDLALRHVAYGVRPEHYDIFREALMGMLDDLSAEPLPDETRAVWLKAYSGLAEEMIASAYGE